MMLPEHIVIIEDEVITQRYLQDIFQQLGVTVSGCFDSADETLRQLKHITCDLILMDINIKGHMDGIQLAREILLQQEVPIVFITAHNDDETVEELLELAPYGFIAKPFSSKDIVVTLQVAYKRYLTYSQHIRECTKDDNMIVITPTYTYAKQQQLLYKDGVLVKLNLKQRQLLSVLLEYPNQAVSYEQLVLTLWGEEQIADSALRTLVYSIRKLLPDFPIVSHSKLGYELMIMRERIKDV